MSEQFVIPESEGTTDKIEAGTEVRFTPEEWAPVQEVIDENRATIFTIKMLGKELIDQERRFWEAIYMAYPELKGFNVSVDMKRGVAYVIDRSNHTHNHDGSEADNIDAPFSMKYDGVSISDRYGVQSVAVPSAEKLLEFLQGLTFTEEDDEKEGE